MSDKSFLLYRFPDFRLFTLVKSLLYSACCVLTAHGSSFPVLVIGRVLGGLSTAILFSAFESWLVGASQAVNLSPRGLDAVFTQQTVLNSILAVFSGLISQFLADYLRQGSDAKCIGVPHWTRSGIGPNKR